MMPCGHKNEMLEDIDGPLLEDHFVHRAVNTQQCILGIVKPGTVSLSKQGEKIPFRYNYRM